VGVFEAGEKDPPFFWLCNGGFWFISNGRHV